MDTPEIRINFSWLLYEEVSSTMGRIKGWTVPTGDQCEEWTESYRNSWSKVESKYLNALKKVTGLEFYKSVIDITTAASMRPKSDPLIIGFNDTPDTVIDTIAHELTHTLLCDNKHLSIYGKNRNFKLGTEWRKLFGFKDDFVALVHVPVFAVLTKVYEELGDLGFVQRDKKLMKQRGADSYLKAWDYVEEVGAEKIIEQLKSSYKKIAETLEKKQ